MNVQETGANFGAIVSGIDMNRLDDSGWDALYRTWLERQVLVVREQELTMEQFLSHGRRFGKLKPHRVRRTRHPDFPELTQMGLGTKKVASQLDSAVYNRGTDWHTDGPWDSEVCKATQLYGLAIPSRGGDTLFANMYTAYDALPADLKKRIEGLHVAFVYGGRTHRGVELLEPEDRDLAPIVHPIARTHPETGRKALYINPFHYLRIVELPQEEGDALAEELFSRMVQPGAEYRHRWHRH